MYNRLHPELWLNYLPYVLSVASVGGCDEGLSEKDLLQRRVRVWSLVTFLESLWWCADKLLVGQKSNLLANIRNMPETFVIRIRNPMVRLPGI